MENLEAVVTIKATESELECIIWALTIIKTVRLPLEPEWKKPYKSLLKDMKRIKEGISETRINMINDQKEESDNSPQKEIEKAQGIYVAGCKNEDCD